MLQSRWLALPLLASVALHACAEPRRDVAREGLSTLPAPAAIPETGPAREPLTPTRGKGSPAPGGAIVLGRLGDQAIALIADEDARALRIVDPASHRELARHALAGRPAQVAVAGDGRAYVSMRDDARVVGLEVAAREPLTMREAVSFETASEPFGLAVTPDGDTLLVTCAWASKLAAFAVAERKQKFEVALAREPRSVAVSRDGRHAYVSHAIGPHISRIDLAAYAVAPVAVAGRDFSPSFGGLFGLDDFGEDSLIGILSSHGPHVPEQAGVIDSSELPRAAESAVGPAVVSGEVGGRGVGLRRLPPPHFAPSSEAVPRDAGQAFAIAVGEEHVFVPLVLTHRGVVTTGGYGTSESFPAHQPAIAMVDRTDEAAWLRVMNQSFSAKSGSEFAGGERKDGCLLPRAAAVSDRRGLLLVSCLGSDEVLAFDTSKDALAVSSRGRWKVAPGAQGLAVDEEAGRVLVWSQFARTLSSIALPERERDAGAPKHLAFPKTASKPDKVTKLEMIDGSRAMSALALRGREIFHAASDVRISSDGRTCASCHPDGRDDGLTWPSPNGPRQTPMLAGRLHEATKPYGWQGDATTLTDHLEQTFRRLGGRGLEGAELESLLAYLSEMSQPARNGERATSSGADLVTRGRELFHSDTVGCATCHKDKGQGSDGARHNVGGGAEVETPSLAFVAGTAPYFHDGRYATLADMLRETKGKMGWAADMSAGDLTALEAYLRTL